MADVVIKKKQTEAEKNCMIKSTLKAETLKLFKKYNDRVIF